MFYPIICDIVNILMPMRSYMIIYFHENARTSYRLYKMSARSFIMNLYDNYGLVAITLPPTLNHSHDNLKNPYWIASIFDIGERIAGKQDGPGPIIYGPPRAPRIAQNAIFFTLGPIYEEQAIIFFRCYKFVCSVIRSYCPEILFTWVQRNPPPGPPKYEKKYIFSYFGFTLIFFLSDCFLIWHVHRYGWEDSWKAR